MWLILQHDKPEDWVIATGQTTTVRDFVKMAFNYLGIGLRFEGKGIDEVGIIDSIDEKRYNEIIQNSKFKIQNCIGSTVVEVDARYFRPTEVDLLLGDPSKAERELGWKREYKLEELVNDMMQSDLKLMQKDEYLKNGGYTIMNYFE
jgi:GDPmannose 4,6-dehydratase